MPTTNNLCDSAVTSLTPNKSSEMFQSYKIHYYMVSGGVTIQINIRLAKYILYQYLKFLILHKINKKNVNIFTI